MTCPRNTRTAATGQAQRRAAPAGGALYRGRGCLIFSVIVYCAAAMCLTGSASAQATEQAAEQAAEQAISTPSGLAVIVQEFLTETDGPVMRLRARFVAPSMTAETPAPEIVLSDMDHLCNTVAIPYLRDAADQPDEIVVSVSAEALEFGTLAPEIPQYFEAYSIQDGTCIWELY